MKSKSSYVLLTCDEGKRENIKKELEPFNEIKEIAGTYGVYDIVIKIESDSAEKTQRLVKDKIRNLGHVRSLLTLYFLDWSKFGFKNNDVKTCRHV